MLKGKKMRVTQKYVKRAKLILVFEDWNDYKKWVEEIVQDHLRRMNTKELKLLVGLDQN